MDNRNVEVERVYEDFEPTSQWATEPSFDTLIVYLPGFKKEQLKVQVTSSRNLRILGERPVSNSGNHWTRFRKEFPISENFDINEITAKYESGTLYIKHPKSIISIPESTKPPTSPQPRPTRPSTENNPNPQPRPTRPSTENNPNPQPQPQPRPTRQSGENNPNPNPQPQPRPTRPSGENNPNPNPQPRPTRSSTENNRNPQPQPQPQPRPTRQSGENNPNPNPQPQPRPTRPSGENNSNPNQQPQPRPTRPSGESNPIPQPPTAIQKKRPTANDIDDRVKDKNSAESISKPNIREEQEKGKNGNKEEPINQKLNSSNTSEENAEDSPLSDVIKAGMVKGMYGKENEKRNVVGELVMEFKKPNKLMNLVVAVLLVLVLMLYARNAVTRIEKYTN